jgi:uncharacterized protein (TIGR00288 family)
LSEVKRRLSIGKPRKDKTIGILIDGPNVLRKEFNISFEDIKKKVQKHGQIKISKVFLDQYATEKLIEAVSNQGFEPIVTSTDVDVAMAAEAMELVFNPAIDVIALMTRDADFQPVLVKAKARGKETLVVGVEPGFSIALKNTADHVITMGEVK